MRLRLFGKSYKYLFAGVCSSVDLLREWFVAVLGRAPARAVNSWRSRVQPRIIVVISVKLRKNSLECGKYFGFRLAMRTAGPITIRPFATGRERVNHIVGYGSLFSATVSDDKEKVILSNPAVSSVVVEI